MSTGVKNYDVLQRIMLLGDSGVGKTCFMSCFANEPVSSSHISTIGSISELKTSESGKDSEAESGEELLSFAGIDFKLHTIEVNGRRVRIQMWDTAGQERFHTLTVQYYRKAQGIILVFDLTNAESFMNIRKWLQSVDQFAQADIKRIIIGNKSDLRSQRAVSTEEGQELAGEYGLDYVETSAIQNINVQQAVKKLSLELLGEVENDELAEMRQQLGQPTQSLVLKPEQKEKGKTACCS